MSTKILLVALGSSGDVDPMVGLGRALHARGHSVCVITNPYFEPLVRRNDLDFIPVGTAEQFLKALAHPDLWNPWRAFFFTARELILNAVRPVYEVLAEHYEPGRTVVVSTFVGMGARIAQEKLGLPLATVTFQPTAFRSVHDTPVGIGLLMPNWAPAFVKRLLFWAVDVGILDRVLCPEINAFRAELGLPRIRRVFDNWYHSPQRALALFPDWFAAPQPDWPSQTRLVSFPLYDGGNVEPASGEVRQFLDAGSPPLLFTFGSAMQQAGRLFAESAEVCRLLGRRGILLTRFGEQIPATLPDGVRHFSFIPFSQVFPRSAAVVHHGGIGTVAQSLAAGVPQLVVPFAHDQPDNANRVRRLGVGTSLLPGRYRAAAVALALDRLINDPEVTKKCRAAADRLAQVRPLEEACRHIEELARANE